MINWKVRLKSPAFWTGLIGVLATLIISLAQLFGLDISAVVGGWEQALIALVTAVFGVLGLVGGSSMTPYEARQGVVMVRGIIYDTEGNSQWGWGTGWAIGKPGEPVEYIVTNGHVVADAYEYPQQYPNEIFGSVEVYYSAAENDFAQAEIVCYSPQTQKDIAILRLPSPTEKRIALSLRESDSVKPGDTAYALGYPGNAVANQPLPKYDMNDVTMTKGIISNRTTLTSTTYEAFQMDVSIAGGNSGGPLVDESGNLIGNDEADATTTMSEWIPVSWSGMTEIQDTYYTDDDATAQAEYQTATARVQAQDKKLETDQKQIETQHKAVETEFESVQKVIQSNIENSFKAFS